MTNNKPEESTGALRKRFIEPPFSVLDARGGEWRKRKAKWLELGIQSELGRDAECQIGVNDKNYMPNMKSGTSIFDPALCELMYKWFAPPVVKRYKCNKCNKIYDEKTQEIM